MTLGQKIKEVRLRKQLTQKDVVGDYMTRNMLSKIENGSAAPSVKTLEFLARALDVPAASIMNDVDDTLSVDARQLDLACDLMDALFESARDLPGERAALVKCLSVLAKARVHMACGDVGRARELLLTVDMETFDRGSRANIYALLEECCKQLNDYKAAYEYAIKRTSGE